MELGRYRILRPLGQGGMATVYLGEDPLLNRFVAIKVIQAHLSSNGKLIERFNVEAKTIASLRHVNIVEIFDFGIQEDQQFLVMEYIDGQSLQTLCSAMAGRPMPDRVVAAIICQAAEGLTSAERHGVVHRDIKPENLLFNSAGVLKIADFGIAHIADEQSRTQTGAVLGSPNFMSPEQVEGLKPTPKTDLFSLGGVFYSCLTGKMPFAGPGIPVTLRNICEKPHAPVASLNPEADPFLIQIVDTLLQKAPADRGDGARWLAQQLRSWLNNHGVVDVVEEVHAFISGLNLPASPTTTGSQFPEIKSALTGKSPGTQSNRIPAPPWLRWAGVGAFIVVLVFIAIIWNLRKTMHSEDRAVEIPSVQQPSFPPVQVQAVPSPPVPVSAPVNPEPDTLNGGKKAKPKTTLAGPIGMGKKPAKKPTKRSDDSSAQGTGKTGYLWIESAPQGAAINIDGKPHDETPMHSWLELPPGKYHVDLAHRLFPPFDTDVTVSGGSRQKFKFRLER